MRRRRNPAVISDMEGVIVLVGVGIGIYLVYQAIQAAKAAGQAAVAGAKAIYSGAQAVTAPVSNVIAAGILKLTQQPPMAVPGNVLFPDGTGAPLSQMAVFTDPSGNVYVKDRGSTYQLQASDSDGDWPAVYVSG